MSTLKVDSLVEKTSGNGVHIAGHVIQVVNMDTAAVTISSSSSLTGTDLLLNITPKFSTSKILVNINAHMSGNGTSSGFMRGLRDASP